MDDILWALWFFLPAGIANVSPILAAQVPFIRNFDYPMDGYLTLRGKRLFGAHKTWRGFIIAVIAGTLTGIIQLLAASIFDPGFTDNNIWDYQSGLTITLGALMGFGAIMGDAIESLLKRQIGVEPGKKWFPFDQIDYIIGGYGASLILIEPRFELFVTILAVWFSIHVISSYIGYRLGWKTSPI